MKLESNSFNLVKEMYETIGIIRNFRTKELDTPISSIKQTKNLLLTGEGSSRIFPAKNSIYEFLKNDSGINIITEGPRHAAELKLSNYIVFGASNSGKTKEIIDYFRQITNPKFALTSHNDSPLGKVSTDEYILNCGSENAVAATKSVIEQALFYQNLLFGLSGRPISKSELNELADKAETVLNMEIDDETVSKVANAKMIYFSGRNNGVAEEATLKANEITRKKADFLEGTYIVHGIEEVMDKDEVVILIDPYSKEEHKIKEVLEGVGLGALAISSRETIFPTIRIPSMNGFDGYLQLLACWNILVSVGLKLGIDLDNPYRARKIGNESAD